MEQNQEFSSSVIVAFVSGIVKASVQLGLNVSRALEDSGLSDQQLQNPTGRIPTEQLERLLGSLSEQYDGGSLCVQLGKRLQPGHFSALGYAVATSRTLGDAVHLILKYEQVVLSSGKTEFFLQEKQGTLFWQMFDEKQSQMIEEILISSRLQLARSFAGQDLCPREVRFTRDQPEDLEVFRSFFCSKLLFNQARNAMVFGLDVLALPIVQADSFINQIMAEQTYQLNHDLTEEGPLERQVKTLLEEQLPKGLLEQKVIAQLLNMSERTLRRRLKGENSSYQQILENLRRHKAEYYLQKTPLSILEIALLLGYSEHSAFSAAYKRWHNKTPAEDRQ